MAWDPVLQENYSAAVLQRLQRFPPAEAGTTAEWLREHLVGSNLALQILEQLEDLAKKEGRSVALLLQEAARPLQKKRLNAKELGRRIRDAFELRLHPFRNAHEASFRTWVKDLGLPSEVLLKAPQNFEGEVFTLQFHFSTAAELESSLRSVLDSMKTKDWTQLWKF